MTDGTLQSVKEEESQPHDMTETAAGRDVERSATTDSVKKPDWNNSTGTKLTRIKVVALCSVVVIIWGVLLLPVVLYQIPTDSNSSCSMMDSLAKENGSGEPPEPVRAFQISSCANITCREGFYCEEHGSASRCIPKCGLWSQYARSTNIAIDFVILLAECIGIISGVAIIVFAGLRWRNVLVFPSSLAVYQAITLLVLSFVIIMSYMDNSALYCSSDDLTHSLSESTVFCIFSGATSIYCLFQLAVFWFLHLLALFWKTRFPIQARSFQISHRMKYIHITCVVIGVLVPLVPVVATMSEYAHGESTEKAIMGGLGFGITRFPPRLCTGVHGDTIFYSVTLPIIVLVMLGITLLASLFWMFHRHRRLFKSRSSHSRSKIEMAERKLLFVFVYYVVVIVFILLGFTLRVRGREIFLSEILCYFQCESHGVDPENPCDTSGYDNSLNVVMTAIAYVLLGVFPLANFIFVVNVGELKQNIKKWLLCQFKKTKGENGIIQKTRSSSTSTFRSNSTSTLTSSITASITASIIKS